ncbi:MAG: helix-turn-helix domain-containing protein [Lachnospiraceae bacterium]|nr:helix-turn-helix domain-containing protein [Lachnospiraceae bacterium]MCM1237506.1 helix-turn-helix domain-containing protein [Ruminococcus flavefaciens]
MTHKIQSVKPLKDLKVSVLFQNGTEKEYDIHKLYPAFPQFKEFELNNELFNQVQVDTGGYGISWNDNLDLDAEDIWEDGTEVCTHDVDVVFLLADSLMKIRDQAGMTQKQLAEATGIYQADISKIERGLGNPSISTLKRLAEGMGAKLKLEFVLS